MLQCIVTISNSIIIRVSHKVTDKGS